MTDESSIEGLTYFIFQLRHNLFHGLGEKSYDLDNQIQLLNSINKFLKWFLECEVC